MKKILHPGGGGGGGGGGGFLKKKKKKKKLPKCILSHIESFKTHLFLGENWGGTPKLSHFCQFRLGGGGVWRGCKIFYIFFFFEGFPNFAEVAH